MRNSPSHLLLAAALLAAMLPVPASFAGRQGARGEKPAEFGDVVKLIEAHFGVKHRGIPMLAKIPLKVAGRFRRFAEVGSVKLATFENQDFSTPPSGVSFAQRLGGRLEPGWQPLVEVSSRPEQSQTHIYAAEAGRLFNVIVIQIGRRDATAVQVSLTPENLGKLLRDPETMGDTLVEETANDPER
jgi:hypothetical protein